MILKIPKAPSEIQLNFNIINYSQYESPFQIHAGGNLNQQEKPWNQGFFFLSIADLFLYSLTINNWESNWTQ